MMKKQGLVSEPSRRRTLPYLFLVFIFSVILTASGCSRLTQNEKDTLTAVDQYVTTASKGDINALAAFYLNGADDLGNALALADYNEEPYVTLLNKLLPLAVITKEATVEYSEGDKVGIFITVKAPDTAALLEQYGDAKGVIAALEGMEKYDGPMVSGRAKVLWQKTEKGMLIVDDKDLASLFSGDLGLNLQ